MKILITGTHFTTALAVIEELKKFNDIDIVYVGRGTTREGDVSKSVESRVLPEYGVKFIPIIAGRLQWSLAIYTIPSLLKIPIGFIYSFFILLREKPAVILSFGGYVSVPVVFCGWLFSIPIIIHEQTLVTGLANKIGSWFADKVAISFKESWLSKSPKAILTGNPLRTEITRGVNLPAGRQGVTHTRGMSGSHSGKPTILITGGNQGSHVINLAVEGCLDKLLKVANIIHQTGDSKFRDYERLKGRQNDRYKVMKWIPEMGGVMKKVDLVVSRAGIMTLSELAYLGKPALVIPISYLYQDEQQKNAKYFEKLGLVKILPQNKLSSKNLFKNIKFCLNEKREYQTSFIIPDAAKRLALETILLGR